MEAQVYEKCRYTAPFYFFVSGGGEGGQGMVWMMLVYLFLGRAMWGGKGTL